LVPPRLSNEIVIAVTLPPEVVTRYSPRPMSGPHKALVSSWLRKPRIGAVNSSAQVSKSPQFSEKPCVGLLGHAGELPDGMTVVSDGSGARLALGAQHARCQGSSICCPGSGTTFVS